MKDYRLSEIVAHCKEMQDKYGHGSKACDMCAQKSYVLHEFCIDVLRGIPNLWGKNYIEPRDMIELPYKESRIGGNGELWDVYFRDKKMGDIAYRCFWDEAEADEFLVEILRNTTK